MDLVSCLSGCETLNPNPKRKFCSPKTSATSDCFSSPLKLSLSTSLLLAYRERLEQEYEKTGDLLVELGSDQTSLHNPFNGGYYPVQVSINSKANLFPQISSCLL